MAGAPPPMTAPPASARRALLPQALVLVGCVVALGLVVATTATNLQQRGIPFGFEYLRDPAGFAIAETLLPYDPADSNLWAIGVGVGNTLFVSLLVAAASTVLGVLVGIGRLSENPLISTAARVWVEGVRNTPPILLLIFLYTLWWQVLPNDRILELAPGVMASIRGLAVPALTAPWFVAPLAVLLVMTLAGLTVRTILRGGGPPDRISLLLGAAGLLAAAGLVFGGATIGISLPHRAGLDIVGGASLTPELSTIVFGLTVYTTGFIAEIVRGGIQAVPKGQWEAARALGFGGADTLRLVILPQMLGVVLPPMTSQYINVVKNSTLALAIGYTDFMTVMGTMINKTSHAVEGTAVIIAVYLAINLAMSALMNRYNRHVLSRGR